MGQYYKAMLLDKQWVKVYKLNGRKMMEHSWYGNSDMTRIEYVLSKSPAHVFWVWDYSNMAPLCWWDYSQFDEEEIEYVDFRLEHEENKVYYLVNETKKEYINMTKQEQNAWLQDNDKWVVHPLWLLCRADTEEAGWDYHSQFPNYDKQGYWCGDKIEVLEVDWDRTEEFKYFQYKDMTDILYFVENENGKFIKDDKIQEGTNQEIGEWEQDSQEEKITEGD